MRSETTFPMSRAVLNAYTEGQEDETLLPLVGVNQQQTPLGRIQPGDSIIFYNIRGEREIELSRSFTEENFREFPVHPGLPVHFTTMIEYSKDLNTGVAFPPRGVLSDTLSDIIAAHGLAQAKITEAEKAVHISYFFNGKKSDPLPKEERIVVPTRKDVRLFDEAPEMSIDEISREAEARIQDPSRRFIVVNFPNVDVVGHIENEPDPPGGGGGGPANRSAGGPGASSEHGRHRHRRSRHRGKMAVSGRRRGYRTYGQPRALHSIASGAKILSEIRRGTDRHRTDDSGFDGPARPRFHDRLVPDSEKAFSGRPRFASAPAHSGRLGPL